MLDYEWRSLKFYVTASIEKQNYFANRISKTHSKHTKWHTDKLIMFDILISTADENMNVI